MPKIKLEHLSDSSRSTYSECSKKWAYKYIYGLKFKPNTNMQVGSVNHKLLEQINLCFKEYGKMPDPNRVQKLLRELMNDGITRELLLQIKRGNKREIAMTDKEFCEFQFENIYTQLYVLASIYMEMALEQFKEILFIEHSYDLMVGDKKYIAIMDLGVRTKKNELKVIDFKTKKRSGAVSTLQLVGYGKAMSEIVGEPIHGLEQWDFLRKKSPEIKINVVDMDQHDALLEVFEEEIHDAWSGIENGVFVRNMRSMLCGEDLCDFWAECMNPKKFKEAQEAIEKEKAETQEYHKDDVEGLDQRKQK
jgi:hypothetical protein